MKKVSFIIITLVTLILVSCNTEVLYSVSFQSNGGNAVETQYITEGKTVEIPSINREGYTLEGWYTSLNGGSTLDEEWVFLGNIITSDIILYANWNPINYTIEFDTNGGSSIQSIIEGYETVIQFPENPTKEGYLFDGWYLDNSTFLNEFTLETMPLNGGVLYAKWIEDIYYGYTVITTVEEFMDMTSNRSGDYILANDLDFTDVEYTIPFGSGKSFLGTFDGQGYTISNITIDELAVYTGVFGTVSSATIENLNIDNVNMGTAEAPLELATSTRIGFAIGYISSQSAEINNVHVTNSSLYIKTASTISTFVGGLIGDMRGSIENSSVENAVIEVETTSTADVRIGGLVGSLWEDATVNESYSTGSIDFTFTGEGLGDTDNSAIDIGGLVGRNEATDVLSPVKDVYSTVDITADFTYNTEDGTEEANYSVNVGGLIGYSSAYVESGFYAGSIELTQTSTEFESNTYKLFSVGGLIGKYFARKALNELVRFGNGESITLTVSEDVNLKFSQLVAIGGETYEHNIGVYGNQYTIINNQQVQDMENIVEDINGYFTSEWIQSKIVEVG